MKKLLVILNILLIISSLNAKQIEISAISNSSGSQLIPDYVRLINPFLGLDTTYKVNGNSKFYIDIDSYLDVKEEQSYANVISQINPNPTLTNSYFDINLLSNEIVNLELYDVLGNRLCQNTYNLERGEYNFDVSVQSLRTGVYFININFSNQSFVQKLIKIGQEEASTNSEIKFNLLNSNGISSPISILDQNEYTILAYKLYSKSDTVSFTSDNIPSKVMLKMDTVYSPFAKAYVWASFNSVQMYSSGGKFDTTSFYFQSKFGNYKYKSDQCDTVSINERIYMNSCGVYSTGNSIKLILNYQKESFDTLNFNYYKNLPSGPVLETTNFSFSFNSTSKWEFKNGTYSTKSTLDNNPMFFNEIKYTNSSQSGPPRYSSSTTNLGKVLLFNDKSYVAINLQMW